MLRTTLLQRQELLRAETLIVDLRCSFDQVLQVSASEEVPEVDEFAVAFVFDVDGSPAVLAGGDGFAVDLEGGFAADYCEGDDGL